MKYSVTERAQCAAWLELPKSAVEVQREFRAEYGKHSQAPDGHSIRLKHTSFMTTGSVQDAKRKRSPFRRNGRTEERTEEKVQRVVQHFEADPHASTRRAALALAISRPTIQRIL